jgi:octaprenyl-diphosphate synthase
MQRGTADERSVIQQAIEHGSVEGLTDIVDIVRKTGALDATRAAALNEAERALATLAYIPDGVYKNALHGLASQLLVRRS